jgi:hypothetical protein
MRVVRELRPGVKLRKLVPRQQQQQQHSSSALQLDRVPRPFEARLGDVRDRRRAPGKTPAAVSMSKRRTRDARRTMRIVVTLHTHTHNASCYDLAASARIRAAFNRVAPRPEILRQNKTVGADQLGL